MGYMLRDRPDGQVEIILEKPVLVGVFPERDVAERVIAYLKLEEPELVADEPAKFAVAAADVAEAEAEDLSDLIPPPPRPVRKSRVQLPAVVEEKPRAPVFLAPQPHSLTEAQLDEAFRRISEGEKVSAVAPDFGLSMFQLRGMWGGHCRKMQSHLAQGGKVACRMCRRDFTPSISHPDTCARCSHE